MIFPIKGIMPGKEKQWKVGSGQVNYYEERNDIFIKESKPYFKVRPEDENIQKYAPFWSHFFDKEAYGTAETGKSELSEVLDTKSHGFETVKPVSLIKKLLAHVKETNNVVLNGNDIILDFFSGSSTTAHAVMKLNAEDDGRRRFIMVQFPEICNEDSETFKAGYKNICELGKARIWRAGDKINKEVINNNAKLKTGENPKHLVDIGFRVLKVDSTNMKDVYYAANKYNQNMIEGLESNIKKDRSDLDLLYGVLIDLGLLLSLSHKIEKIDGINVHTVDNGDLIACFEEKISEGLVREIAKRQPHRVVFRDSSFATSPAKINVAEIFKLLAPNTIVKVI